MATNIRAIIEKLNATTRNALDGAAQLCLSRTHYNIEIEHFLLRLLEATGSDFASIVHQFGIDTSRLTAELNRSLDRMKTGNGRNPVFSPTLVEALREGWTFGSLEHGAESIRSGYVVLAIVSVEDLVRTMRDISRELQKINPEALRKDFLTIVGNSEEQLQPGAARTKAESGEAPRPGGATKTPFLDQYTVNLTENAKKGKIDPVLGRDTEIRQVVDILTRRRQNNPILVGEAGVGKTAVVEGFAVRVANGDVPGPLKNVSVHVLDLALLQAGAGVKGEFENRLKGLINEVKSSPIPIILFIDEAHTMIGAGGQAGQNDAANLLKPALARGELRTVAATTWSEYKKYFEKDPALTRRFQTVKVEEPSELQCELMLRGVVPALEKHHNVRILDEGLAAAVRFSHRYLPDRQLPDKAVSVLDTACARLALGQSSIPPAIEDAQRKLDDLAVQTRVLEREVAAGADHAERLEKIAEERAATEAALGKLNERWERERKLVEQIRTIRLQLEEAHAAKLESAAKIARGTANGAAGQSTVTETAGKPGDKLAAAPAVDEAALRSQLAELNLQLEALQGENPLIRVCVDGQIVGEVLSAWTGIPVGKMLKDEVSLVLKLEDHLGRRVIGQDHALSVISQRIRTSRARLDDPNKPVGTFLLVGPSGVGKTETALALSDLLYGGEKNLITINMSEFQEAHTVSTLKGSPPGYVGYGEGGVLTEAVRRRPYSVVLLDEVEKAHPDVLELFFQVFDKGQMEDGEGREIDFKNTIIILTSNAGTDILAKLCADPETMPGPVGLVQALKPELDKVFKPAFLGRLVISPYYPVRDEALKQIIRLKLGKIQRRLRESHQIALTYDPELVNEVARRCTEVESGARNVDNILTNTLLPDVSRQLLTAMAEGNKPNAIHVGLGEDGSFVYTEPASAATDAGVAEGAESPVLA
ncbi:MAG TPA: type VI secretion system ATPase TssH [Bryobacteraceae bacterium]|jgi:type VI secretion system protein VasG|nr:type VI secretion system ATPase TssH [Bryobacteraceae bacterium]